MTNLIATLIIITNTHWTVVKTEPSYVKCAVFGCQKDHSEKRTESATICRAFIAEVQFDGTTNRFPLRAEILTNAAPTERVLYSGFDYTKQTTVLLTNWSFPNISTLPLNFYVTNYLSNPVFTNLMTRTEPQ